jgi:hypothetical protein
MRPEDVATAPAETDTDTGPPNASPVAPVRHGPGMRPALLVVGIAAGLVLVFGVLAVVSSQGSGNSAGTSGTSAPTKVEGTSLLAVPAAKGLKPIEHTDTPPGNIIDTLSLPQGATVLSVTNNTTSANQYDEQMQFSVSASEAAVVDFYRVELAAKGWKLSGVNPATNLPGGIEVLAQKGGDDGWYWEAGAVVSPTTFGANDGSKGSKAVLSPPTSSAATDPNGIGAESTKFTFRLFQVPDED